MAGYVFNSLENFWISSHGKQDDCLLFDHAMYHVALRMIFYYLPTYTSIRCYLTFIWSEIWHCLKEQKKKSKKNYLQIHSAPQGNLLVVQNLNTIYFQIGLENKDILLRWDGVTAFLNI